MKKVAVMTGVHHMIYAKLYGMSVFHTETHIQTFIHIHTNTSIFIHSKTHTHTRTSS